MLSRRRSKTNIVDRLFLRQILTPRPGTSVNCVRKFYENLVPSYTICDIQCPDHHFRKFTDDGLYLISFSRNQQELIVYRPSWLTYSCKEESLEGDKCCLHDLPSKAYKFESLFTRLYSLPLASSNEVISRDFFLYMESNQFGLFATSSPPNHDAPTTEGAVLGVPSIGKITFYLVRLEDGVIMDERGFSNDFINLGHSSGVFLYEDLLSIMSLRFQTIYILQIRDSGSFVDVHSIGAFCREDDELFLSSYAQEFFTSENGEREDISENGLQQHHGRPFLSGIKQRLLSFIFRGIWNEETDHALRVQRLKKKFYFHFQDYVDLIMWKVQFLDRHHLLIKFGSVDGGVSRNADHHPAFFAVYSMETTNVIAFYQQNSADELYYLFEKFADHFRVDSRNSMHMNFISSHSNNIYALEQLNNMKSKATNPSQFVKKMLVSLPVNCQSQSPSPYFDQSLFRFDEKLISAADRVRQLTEHPIKFTLRRYPNSLKFKIMPGLEAAGGGDSRSNSKKLCMFIFHPFLPFAISIQQTYMEPTVVNIHLRK